MNVLLATSVVLSALGIGWNDPASLPIGEQWRIKAQRAPVVLVAELIGHEFDTLAPGEIATSSLHGMEDIAISYRVTRVVRDQSNTVKPGAVLSVRQRYARSGTPDKPFSVTFDRATGDLRFFEDVPTGGWSSVTLHFPRGRQVVLLLTSTLKHACAWGTFVRLEPE